MSGYRDIEMECLMAFENGIQDAAIGLLMFVDDVHNLKMPNTQQTVFHLACYHGWIDIAKMLIDEYQFDKMCTDIAGNTSLHMACRQVGNLRVIQYLIRECHCDPMSKNYHGDTPLHLACKSKNMPVIQYLVNQCQCDLMSKNNDQITPLYLVYRSQNRKLIQFLNNECYRDPLSMTNDCTTLLHLVYSNENMEMVYYLINKCHFDLTSKSNDGNTLLHLACDSRDMKMVHYLISNCHCNPMSKNNDGNTPLHLACSNRDIQMVRYLINECHCDPKSKNNDGNTPLHLGCTNRDIPMVYYLINECHCDPMNKNNDGNTPLHLACTNRSMQMVCYLINECYCDPMSKNNDGNTPLHLACTNRGMQMVRYLINECHCDPMSKNNDGNTPLHLACTNRGMQMVRYLINECHCDPMSKNNDGNTPLHLACTNRGMQMVRYLINECHCDPMSKNNDGNTPLHQACILNDTFMVRYLISEYQFDLASENYDGNTPLHIACQHCLDNTSIIEELVSIGKFDPLAKNKFGSTPLTLVPKQYKEKMKAVFAKFGKIQISHPVNSYVNVVLLGNPGVGKSTLAQVIIQRASGVFASVRGLFQYVKGVELYTAGIIPSKLEHRELGNVILHDSAGQSEYYSSHIAVLENLLHGSAAVFIIVVRLSESEVYKHLHHWLTIVENESHKALGQCHVVVVASHIDEVEQKHRPGIYRELADITSSRLSQQSGVVNCGLVPLDCRGLVGGELSSFTTTLSGACQSIRSANTREMSLYCHMLYGLLEETKESVFTLDQLRTLVIESEEYYVPIEIEKATELLSSLHATGLIVFLKNIQTPGNSWIVSRKGVLLTEINGVLFAPENFKQHRDIASNTGIITLSTVSRLFSHFSSEMLVLFLQYMELCQEISQDFLTSSNLMMRDDESSDGIRDRLLFFPALIRNTERPQEINGTFQFGWCLQCCNPHHFFLPRFLHVLLLHLAFRYALPKSRKSRLHRRCSIWTSGIQWGNTSGVESLVELVDNSQCLLLLMSFQIGSEESMLCLCKQLICEILSLQQQLCPSLKLQEFVIEPSQLHYPIQKPSTLTLYDIELIASCIIQKEQFVLDTEGVTQPKRISDLFPFEPIQPDTLSVFAGRNPEVSDLILYQIIIITCYLFLYAGYC